MMQSSLLTVYMEIYIIQTRVPVRIYIHSYSKKNQTVYEKRSDLTVTYFASSSSVAGWTISLADKHCWRRILPFGCALVIFGQTETESINQYPLKTWYFGLIFSNELFVQFNNPVLLHKILFLGWNISFIFNSFYLTEMK